MNSEDVKLRNDLSEVMYDLARYLNSASHAASEIAEMLELTDGEIKQLKVKTSLRDDAIDDLLRKEGYTW